MSDVHSDLANEASAWATEHGETPPPGKSPQPEAAAAPSSPPAQETKESAEPTSAPISAKAREASNGALAALLVGLIDIAATHYVGARMKLADEEKAQLVALTEPVLDKYLPEVDAGPEAMLLAGVAVIYGPKYLSPEPAKREQTPAGGTSQSGAGSGGQPTSATVDGRDVKAEVLS